MPHQEASPIEDAKALIAEHNAARRLRDDLDLVLGLSAEEIDEVREQPRLIRTRERLDARGWLNGSRPGRRVLERMRDETADRIEQLGRQLPAARDVIEADHRRHASAVAKEIEPRHRAAVAAMLAAAEALSAAIEAEEVVRRELHARAGQSTSTRLPAMAFCGGALGTVNDRFSPIGIWARAARRHLDGSA